MKLPWTKKIEEKEERIVELERKVERLKDERDSFQERFRAEKDRRSDFAREKQEAEEELNRLKDKVAGIKSDAGSEEEEREEVKDARRLLDKLGTIRSTGKELVTVRSPGSVDEVDDYRGLKNSVTEEQMALLQGQEAFGAFLDSDVLDIILRTRPFMEPGWELGKEFDIEPLLEFIESEKIWVLVSAGETRIYSEEAGSYEEVDQVKSRVDRKHSKGGFSQDRFERKREEQLEQHLEHVREAIADEENVYLLGDRKLCEELPGEYLGGFDRNSSPPEVFYRFQVIQ